VLVNSAGSAASSGGQAVSASDLLKLPAAALRR
jgi:hypothetical protein